MELQLNIAAITAATNSSPEEVRNRYRLDHEPLTLQTVVQIVVETGLTYTEVMR